MSETRWNVVASVNLKTHQRTSRTRHSINAKPLSTFVRLEIAKWQNEAGFYLMHYTGDGEGTDTFHETLEDAMAQAEFEFGVQASEWQIQ